MKKIIFILLCAFSTVTNVSAEWTDTDEKLYIASQLAIMADWTTTRYAARHNFPNNTYETNIILGRRPSVAKVDLYCIGLLATNHLIANAMPDNVRGYYFTFKIAAHGAASIHNVQAGWQMKF
jgi:hypothetical protein